MRRRTRFAAKLATYFPLAIPCCVVSLACVQLLAQGRTGDRLSPGKGDFVFLDRHEGKSLPLRVWYYHPSQSRHEGSALKLGAVR